MITEGWQPSELHGTPGPPKPPPRPPAPLECAGLTWNPWHKGDVCFNKIWHTLPRYWLFHLGRAFRNAVLWKCSEMVPKAGSCAAWWISKISSPSVGLLGSRTNYSVAIEKMQPFKILFNIFLLGCHCLGWLL